METDKVELNQEQKNAIQTVIKAMDKVSAIKVIKMNIPSLGPPARRIEGKITTNTVPDDSEKPKTKNEIVNEWLSSLATDPQKMLFLSLKIISGGNKAYRNNITASLISNNSYTVMDKAIERIVADQQLGKRR